MSIRTCATVGRQGQHSEHRWHGEYGWRAGCWLQPVSTQFVRCSYGRFVADCQGRRRSHIFASFKTQVRSVKRNTFTQSLLQLGHFLTNSRNFFFRFIRTK